MKFLAIILASVLGYVNPFVGTDGHGHTFPGAAYPFGMMQISPDTRPNTGDWDGCSGYHYSDSLIYGFSHTHLSGTGCDDLCDVLLMPVTGFAADSIRREEYRSPFSHEEEKASPGYYEVFLEKPRVLARMAVGSRAGVQEYIYPEGVAPQIILDLNHRDYLLDNNLTFYDNAVCGARISSSWAKRQTLYFYIEFSHRIQSHRESGAASVLTFKVHKDNVIRCRIGISSVSVAAARENLIEENITTLEKLQEKTAAEWNRFLSLLECPSEDEEVRKCFYTALYHVGIHPSLYSDSDGGYTGMDGMPHFTDGWDRFTIFSLWDTFRGLHPLLCELSPDLTLQFINSFLSIFTESGKLPVWELWGNETDCMIGYHSAPVFAEALSRGICDFNVDLALSALVNSSLLDERGMRSFRTNGLVLADDEHESVSKTLEYAYDDWCVAQVAAWLLDHPDRTIFKEEALREVYEAYMKTSQYWRNVFDPSTGFMRARLNGRWLTPFDPAEVNVNYTEGNSWQYSFFVPHDIVGMMRAMGGPSGLCAKLDSLFSASEETKGLGLSDITGRIGQYAHGNEPSHHIPYLYALAGKPEKTKEIVDKILSNLYSSTPDGLCGNDDCGQMSAWYVLSLLGRYPECPGVEPGTLTYVPKTIVVNPVFEMEREAFVDSLIVSISNIDVGAKAWWRTGDGEFVPYTGPFVVFASSELECYSEMPDSRKSFTTRSVVRKLENGVDLVLETPSNRLYSADGPSTLVDGLRGRINWRSGRWLGFNRSDYSAVIDLGERKKITEIGAGFLQDQNSWIWMPRYVDFMISDDGVNYKKIAHVPNNVDERDPEVQTLDFVINIVESKTIMARYVKVFAKNIGIIPEWHKGAGGNGFIFTDEFWVK